MLKNVISVILGIYIVLTTMYFGHKLFPVVKEYLSKNNNNIKTSDIKNNETAKECISFEIGHIAGDEFRIKTRFKTTAKDIEINSQNVQQVIYEHSCDKTGTKAIIYYDSRPIAFASIVKFDYSVPLGKDQKDSLNPEIYTILKADKILQQVPDSGYITAVYEFNEKNMQYYSKEYDKISKEDDELILSSCDTIFYKANMGDPDTENSGNENDVEIEYHVIKTDIQNNKTKDFVVLVNWYTSSLPKDVKYTSIFALHLNPDGSLNRYILFPVTKTRKSKFHLFQVIDTDEDGYKEIIIRKSRDENDTFISYDFNHDEGYYSEFSHDL